MSYSELIFEEFDDDYDEDFVNEEENLMEELELFKKEYENEMLFEGINGDFDPEEECSENEISYLDEEYDFEEEYRNATGESFADRDDNDLGNAYHNYYDDDEYCDDYGHDSYDWTNEPQ